MDDICDGDHLIWSDTTVDFLRELVCYLSLFYRVEHEIVWIAVCEHGGIVVGAGCCTVVEWEVVSQGRDELVMPEEPLRLG